MTGNLDESDSTDAGQDWWAMGELLSLTVDQVVAPIEGMHRAISNRWLGLAGQRVDPVRRAYDGVVQTVYRTVRLGGSALGAVGPAVISLLPRHRSTASPRGVRTRSGIRAAANAVWGDQLAARGSRLAVPMQFRTSHGDPIETTPSSLAAGFPEAGDRVVVLLHGLGETERCWRATDNSIGLPAVLDREGWSSVFVRYNTGLRISSNGEELASLLRSLEAHWPVPVESIALVGHSMGGLVTRSALEVGHDGQHDWVRKTRHLVALGSPHLGSPIEKGANALAWGLGHAKETRPLGDFLRSRSEGIKDLRFGTISKEDWDGVDADTVLQIAVDDVAPPAGIAQHFVAGVVTEDASHPIGAAVGDLIVRVGSATGQGRRRRVAATDLFVLGRQRHFDLPTDPAVHTQVRDWLASAQE